MTPHAPAYRVISRRSAAFALLAMLVLGGLIVFHVQQVAEAWVASFQLRLEGDPAQAAAWLHEHLAWFFVLSPVVLSAAALLVIWQGLQTLRSGFSPPPGAWIVQGQRTWSGRSAKVRGHLQWVLGSVLLLAVWVGSWYAYHLVDALLRPLMEQ